MNWLLGGLMCVVAALLAAKLCGSLKAAWMAAGLVCLNSYWWLQQTELMPENLNAVLLGLAVWCWPTFSERTRAVGRRLRKHGVSVVVGGFCLGLALLTKPLVTPALLLLPVLTAILSPANQRQSQVAFALIFVVIAALPVGAWSTRNYRQLHRWVPITTGSGAVFWGAHAPDTLARAKGSWTNQPLPADYQVRLDAVSGSQRELLSSQLGWEAGWASLRSAGLTDVCLHFALKPLRLWSPSTFFPAEGPWLAIKFALIAINLLTLASFFSQLRPEYTATPLAVTFAVSLTLTALVFWGTIRFQYTLLPIICGYASLAWYKLLPDWAVFQWPPRRSSRNAPFRSTKFG
jgi:4-amino-4-deoxy-L-arabinose transferase-like glycosyltransferase